MNQSRLALGAKSGGALCGLMTPGKAANPHASGASGWGKVRLAALGLLLAGSFSTAIAAAAPSVNLAWNANPETDVASYKVKYGTSSGSYSSTVDAGKSTAATIPGLTEGTTYYFTVTATNTAGAESPAAGEISHFVPRGAYVSPAGWTLQSVDSQEESDAPAIYAFDGNPATFWHTQWRSNSTPPPHDLQINLGSSKVIAGFRYLPRQDSFTVGYIGQYEFYVSPDGVNWGGAVATGTFAANSSKKEVAFTAKSGQYIRLRALTEASGGTNSSVAELEIIEGTPATPNRTPVANAATLATNEDVALAITLTGTDADGDVLGYSVATQPANGTLTGTAPNLTYTPRANYHGTDSFTFRVHDGLANSAVATVAITVNAVNDPPTANSKVVSTQKNKPLSIVLTGADVENDTLAFSVSSQPGKGTLSGTPPNLTYTPDSGHTGSDSFTFRVHDGREYSAAGTISISVTPTNAAPSAIARSVTTKEDLAVAVQLSGTDEDGDTLAFTVSSQPARGSLTGTAPNLTYTPSADFHGTDSFTYQVNDGTVSSTPATVSITVTPVNDAPVATSKTVTTLEDTALAIVLGGTDKDGDTLSYTVLAQPGKGTLTGTPPNLTYTPADDFHGTDSFTFRANDGTVDSSTATISITVTPVNDGPTVTSATLSTPEDTPFAITLAGKDKDNDTLSFTLLTQPANGTLTGTAPNLTYTPRSNFHGTDSFTYRASDGKVNSSTGTITVSVSPVNDAPIVTGRSLSTTESLPVAMTLAGSDVDGDTLTLSVVSSPSNGTLSGTIPNLSYQPAAGFTGTDSFTYRANDGTVDSTTATVTITVTRSTNPATPGLVPRSGWTLKYVDSQELFDSPAVFAFDGNPETFWHTQWRSGSTTTMPHEIQINMGTVQDVSGFIYQPRQDAYSVGNVKDYEFYVSTDGTNWGQPVASGSFANTKEDKQVLFTTKSGQYIRFRILSEIYGNQDVCVAELNVVRGSSINRAPAATAQTLSTEADTPLPVVLAGTDPDGGTLSFSVETVPVNGTLSGTPPNLTYLPKPGFAGTDSFTFRANDGAVSSSAAKVSITVTPVTEVPGNVAPVFSENPIKGSATQDEPFSGQLRATDANPGDVLTFRKISGPAWLTVSDSGELGGTPTNANVGTNSFTVKVSDSSNASATATLSVRVENVNDAPAFKISPLVYPAGTEKVIYRDQTLASAASDPDSGDSITYSKISGPGWLTVSRAGTLGGTPPAGSSGANAFVVRVTDVSGAWSETSLQIWVNTNTLPLPWSLERVGTGNKAGAARYNAGIFTMAGAGALAQTADAGNFGWQKLGKKGQIIARVRKIHDTGDSTRVGLMIRASLAANSRQAFVGVDGDGDYQFLRRAETGGKTAKVSKKNKNASHTWLRLQRDGNTITAYQSTNGTKWVKVGKTKLSLPENCYIGLSVSSGDKDQLNTSKFSNVRVVQ